MKLTDREKKMLLILLVVSVFTLSLKYVIVPSVEAITTSKLQLSELEMLEKEINITVEAFSNIDEKIKTEYELNKSDYFYKNIDDTYVDNMMQDFIESYNLKLISLSFGMPNEGSTPENLNDISSLILNLINQKLKLENSDASLANQNLENQAEKTSSSENNLTPIFYCTINIQGNLDDVMNMVNTINKSNKSINVTSVNGSISGGTFTGNLTVEIYYIV
ncbi:MAG: hypothetical protein AB7V48_03365 [Sedimentibacter sp.]